MKSLFRVSAVALALVAGTALAASPAMAGGGYHDRWGGKSWGKKHYKHYKHRKHYSRRGNRGYGWNRRYYGWNKRYYDPYWYGPRRPAYGWYHGGPGFSLRIY